MTRLDAATTDRLAKLAGMLSSAHEGERSNAAALATKLLHGANLTWDALVRAGAAALAQSGPRPPPHVATARWALAFPGLLSDREADFLRTIVHRKSITPRQAAFLDSIAAELRRGGAS